MIKQTKSIYILLTQTGSLFTKTIQRYTEAPYNHVSIAFDISLREVYSFGRKHPRNPLYGGFVKEDVYYGTYRYFPKTTCMLFRLDVSSEELNRVKQVISSFENNKQLYRYNLIGLFGVVVNYPVEIKNAYFCSQFVAEVLKKSGIDLWNKPSALITPNDFLDQQALQIIYEGNLYDFPLLLPADLYQPRSFRKTYIYSPYKKIKQFIIG